MGCRAAWGAERHGVPSGMGTHASTHARSCSPACGRDATSKQATNQPTKHPSKQASKQAGKHATNQPTKSTKTGPSWAPYSIQNPPSWGQNPSSLKSKWSKISSKMLLGGVLGGSWVQEGPKSQKCSKNQIVVSLLGAQVGSKNPPNAIRRPSRRRSFF